MFFEASSVLPHAGLLRWSCQMPRERIFQLVFIALKTEEATFVGVTVTL
jgi:hypothetical protein